MQIHHGTLKAILNWVKAEMLPGIILAWHSMIYAILMFLILLMFIVYCLFGLLILFYKNLLISLKNGTLHIKQWLSPGLNKIKKDNFFTGLGYWTRANPEMCLLATKGKPKRISKSVNQLIISKLQEHSKKPDEIRNRIVELCGDLPRIELFARQKTPGWDVWGNEV